ncbi:hypothetical protein [Actinomadura sp. 9N215]|uniref:hypothetical protein n=1 Tax=Actinomadura sp. 9N215 TaxID=3375150 RepID=UPI0037BA6FEE
MDVKILLLISVPIVGGILGAVRQFVLYPCRTVEWKYTFGLEYRDKRRAVRSARKRRQRVESENRKRVAAAERNVEAIRANGRERVRELSGKREELLRWTRGRPVGDPLGRLWLHEHALLIAKKASEEQESPDLMWLAGLRVDIKFATDNNFIKLIDRNKRRCSIPYPRSNIFSEEKVQEFVDRIHNQVQEDNDFRRDQQHRAAEIASEIERFKTETAANETAASSKLAEVTKERDAAAREVDAAWKEACDTWQELTGRRPRSWWRW